MSLRTEYKETINERQYRERVSHFYVLQGCVCEKKIPTKIPLQTCSPPLLLLSFALFVAVSVMRHSDLWTDSVKDAWGALLEKSTCRPTVVKTDFRKTLRDLRKCSDACVFSSNSLHQLERMSTTLVSFKFVGVFVCFLCTSVDLFCLGLLREHKNSKEVCYLSLSERTDRGFGKGTQTPVHKRLDVCFCKRSCVGSAGVFVFFFLEHLLKRGRSVQFSCCCYSEQDRQEISRRLVTPM